MQSVILIAPNPERDAPYAVAWFEADRGRETLLLMGNTAADIQPPTLQIETKRLQEFLKLEQQNQQLTWQIYVDDKTVGAAWIVLVTKDSVRAPSIHIMIGDPDYRGKGIGTATMTALIDYIRDNLVAKKVYTRHLKNNAAVTRMNKRLGFEPVSQPYVDNNQLEWQNVELTL